MGDVTGPISTLPGSVHVAGSDRMCDHHPDRAAVVRIQGETDSFGCEMHDLCAACAKAFREPVDTSGACDWCHNLAPKRSNTRDYEEGLSGRVYQVCAGCLKRQQDEINAELDDFYSRYDCSGEEA